MVYIRILNPKTLDPKSWTLNRKQNQPKQDSPNPDRAISTESPKPKDSGEDPVQDLGFRVQDLGLGFEV